MLKSSILGMRVMTRIFFSNLSDFMGTPSDFYASQATLSGLELSPNVPMPPPAKDISPTTQAITIPTSQSGL